MADTYFASVGRRKSAVATVRLTQGTGQFSKNGEIITPISRWLKPLLMIGKKDSINVSIIVKGGGMTSQNDAIVLGIARAVVKSQSDAKKTLRKAGLVTVDARVKERKKPGLKRARKAPQWAKR